MVPGNKHPPPLEQIARLILLIAEIVLLIGSRRRRWDE
jgi:hypothetical protein